MALQEGELERERGRVLIFLSVCLKLPTNREEEEDPAAPRGR